MIFDSFSSNEIQNVFQIGSKWLGIVLIWSEWISIWYFCQGNKSLWLKVPNTENYFLIWILSNSICTKNLMLFYHKLLSESLSNSTYAKGIYFSIIIYSLEVNRILCMSLLSNTICFLVCLFQSYSIRTKRLYFSVIMKLLKVYKILYFSTSLLSNTISN